MWKKKYHSLLDRKHLIGYSTETFYLVYTDDADSPWFLRYLKKGYKHVYLVKFDGLFWIKLEYTLGFQDIRVLPYDMYDSIETIIGDEKYQKVTVRRKIKRYRTFIAPPSCVEAMKSVMGLREYFLLTPWQLFNYVEQRNGEII